MKINELIKELQKFSDEIGDSDSSPHAGEYKGNVTFKLYDKSEFGRSTTEFEIVEIEPDCAGGCGCWIGCEIILKQIYTNKKSI